MALRSVACSHCRAEIKIAAPEVDGYFLLPRACPRCSRQNAVEISNGIARVIKPGAPDRRREITLKIAI